MASYEIDPRRGIVETLSTGFRSTSPVTDAIHGLWRWTRFVRSGNRRNLAEAKRVARWLPRRQDPRTWRYRVRYSWGPRVPDGRHRTPRAAASVVRGQLAGDAISLLSRLYRQTGERRYLREARLALRPFTRRFGHGGLVSRFLARRHPFYEGYATLPVRSTRSCTISSRSSGCTT